MGVSSVAPSTVSGPTQCHDKPNSDGRQLDKAHCPPHDDRGWLFPKRCGGGSPSLTGCTAARYKN